MDHRRSGKLLRSPALLAGAICLSLLLAFFLGDLSARSRSAEVTVAAKAPVEEPWTANELVNINTADEALLQTLPGIGPVLAERIIAYREANGGFHATEELTNVKGIGSVTFDALRELITVDSGEENNG